MIDVLTREQSNISEIQKEVMIHALGLNYHETPTRNNYYTDSDDKVWNDLVEKGYAKKGRGWEEGSSYFFVTEAGKAALLAVMDE